MTFAFWFYNETNNWAKSEQTLSVSHLRHPKKKYSRYIFVLKKSILL